MSNNSYQYVSATKINKVSDLKALAEEIRSAYLKKIDTEIPMRSLILKDNPFSAFVSMPAYSTSHGLFITKIGAVVPNETSSVRAHIVAYPIEPSRSAILLDGLEITKLKCAAVSALITDKCAREEANILTIIGSGVQAREQINGISSVRDLSQIRVYSRNPTNVINFIRKNKKIVGKAKLVACDSIRNALKDTDIIATTTTSADPLFSYQDLPAHPVHINCMGAHTPHSGELSLDIITQSKLIVEDKEMAIAEAGQTNKNSINLAEFFCDDTTSFKEKLTVFRSTGHAFLDLLTVAHVINRLKLH